MSARKTQPQNEAALKAARTASCRKRQVKDYLRHCDRKGYTVQQRALLLALWVHTANGQNGSADPSAMCWPKVGTLAMLTGLSDRSVTRLLAELADAGEVWIARPGRGKGGLASYLNVGSKRLDRGVNVYLITHFAPESELRQWAAMCPGETRFDRMRVEGTGQEKYRAATSADPRVAATG